MGSSSPDTTATSARSSPRRCATRATTSSGSTPSTTAAATSARPAELEPRARRDVRDVTPAELAGFDAVVHLAALSNDPLGDLDPDWTYAINLDGTIALARRREGGRRRAVRLRLVLLACTAPSTGDELLDEDAPLRPLTPYAESKVRAEEALARARGRRLRAGVDAERDGVRRLTAAAARHRPQQPRRRGRTRPARSGCRATAPRGGRSSTFATSPRATLALLDAPPRPSAARRSTSARRAELPDPRPRGDAPRRLPDCEVTFAEGATPDPRSYRVDFSKFEATVPGLPARVDRGAGDRRARPRVRSSSTSRSTSSRGRYVRLRSSSGCSTRRRLDDELRWRS